MRREAREDDIRFCFVYRRTYSISLLKLVKFHTKTPWLTYYRIMVRCIFYRPWFLFWRPRVRLSVWIPATRFVSWNFPLSSGKYHIITIPYCSILLHSVDLAFGTLYPSTCSFGWCFLFSLLQLFKYTTCFDQEDLLCETKLYTWRWPAGPKHVM
jgi:hypothetical protein